mmetsp:Transcript_3293/g.6404  ORF Transcript_3293/g.6404 Transcript_3293/m.6404 type:complete len:174 (+) Transcript_3293:749-1270(+)
MSNYNLPTSNINIRNHPIDINKKFEYTILLKLFENSFGSCTNMNIIYKKNLESFFLYPTFSTLILFFGNHEIIKKISSILMKYSFTETRVQNYIIILLSGAVNNIIQQQNSYNVINKKLDISQLTTSEILNYITMKSFYIRNNYKKYILEILIKNNNYLDYFTFNKTTLVNII